MTPRLALDLSFDGITLLVLQDDDVWAPAGRVALDAPDLAAALSELRDLAARFGGAAFTTILLIPDSQIRFMIADLEGRDPSEAAGRAMDGRQALTGLTQAFKRAVQAAVLDLECCAPKGFGDRVPTFGG